MKTSGFSTRHATLFLALIGALASAGCAGQPTNAQIGTGVGAVVGGATGHVLFGGPIGTIGGAAAGALIGNEVGKNQRAR
ncbi:MAG TPA: glycine zipper 2TM domain-containing protein [Ottowia sp.]|uniref:glycine zipper 2TM domain-containing protein n=1 Tax=Ottowia sp. TaxID=1898956 RepID=UPI002BE7F9DA|nr:glycine zipper 2TM domain-containing protein [Ottowia sp.]HMN20420.1 glycine zipper 2TM domain-containing protein [Ottowia sp.]